MRGVGGRPGRGAAGAVPRRAGPRGGGAAFPRPPATRTRWDRARAVGGGARARARGGRRRRGRRAGLRPVGRGRVCGAGGRPRGCERRAARPAAAEPRDPGLRGGGAAHRRPRDGDRDRDWRDGAARRRRGGDGRAHRVGGRRGRDRGAARRRSRPVRGLRRQRHRARRDGPAAGAAPYLARDRHAGRPPPGPKAGRAAGPGRGPLHPRGETVLRRGQLLTSREIGMLAAVGRAQVPVVRRPRVAILSTGDELVPPGSLARPGQVYDSNAAVLAAAVEEEGGVPVRYGISPDDEGELRRRLAEALECDTVLLSGGTSKGAGDLSYRVVRELREPGVVAHGVALKPGKPLCLAVTRGKPVVILPGFPTSAIVTFHEFVAPVIRAFAGRAEEAAETVPARLAVRTPSERGRTEFVMVSLVRGPEGLAAYPLGKGSGSVTSFAQADGFVTVPALVELVEAGTAVEVWRIGRRTEPAGLVVIGSHCVGLDLIVGRLRERNIATKLLNVGSTGGLAAAKRGECDIAPVHLMDPATGEYNWPYLVPGLELVPGYGRLQGIVFRPGDPRFEGRTAEDAVAAAAEDRSCVMVNRNPGSGTRVLIDRLLGAARPEGYRAQPRSHNALAVAGGPGAGARGGGGGAG